MPIFGWADLKYVRYIVSGRLTVFRQSCDQRRWRLRTQLRPRAAAIVRQIERHREREPGEDNEYPMPEPNRDAKDVAASTSGVRLTGLSSERRRKFGEW